MDKGIALFIPDLQRLLIGVVVAAVYQAHLGAVALGGLHLGNGCAVGQADQRGNAAFGGRQRYALGVVARGAGDDASGLFLVGQVGDLVARAPQLKGAGILQVFRLEIQLAVGRDAVGPGHRRFPDDGLQRDGSLKNLINGQHGGLPLEQMRSSLFCFSEP